jgi:hypothetical protein
MACKTHVSPDGGRIVPLHANPMMPGKRARAASWSDRGGQFGMRLPAAVRSRSQFHIWRFTIPLLRGMVMSVAVDARKTAFGSACSYAMRTVEAVSG